MNQDRRRGVIVPVVVLAGITLLALLLRMLGLGFGLPYAESRPDELLIITPALKYGTGDLNPHSFYYPSLFSYLLFGLYGVYAVILKISGQILSFAEILGRFADDPSPFFFLSRSVSACLGVLTIPGLYLLARQCFSRFASLIAAFFMAVAYLHVRDSHFGVTDVPMTAFVVFAMIPIIRILSDNQRRNYVMAGVFAGLATSFKYNAGLLAVSILVAHWLSAELSGKPLRQKLFNTNLWFAAFCMLGVFAATSPFVFIDWPAFIKDFKFDIWLLSGEGEVKVGNAWIRHFMVTLWHGIGPPMLLLAIAGILVMMFEKVRKLLVLIVFPVIYYMVIGRGHTVLVRYIIPVVPFLCLFAGVAIGEYLLNWLRRCWGDKSAFVVTGLAACLVSVIPFSRSVAFDRVLMQADTREQVVKYVEGNFTNGTVLGWVGTRYGLPKFAETHESIRSQIGETLAGGKSGLLLNARLALAERKGIRVTIVKIPAGDLAALVRLPTNIWVEYYPVAYSINSYGDAERLLAEKGYRRIIEFCGAPRSVLDDVRMIYDTQDSFYVPFAGVSMVRCPGPSLSLWTVD